MPGAIAACFRCAPAAAAAAAPLASASASSAAGPSLATSVYETHLGLVALSWSRTSLGLSLRAVLRLSCPPTPGSSPAASSSAAAVCFGDDPDEETLAFRVRPWLLWRRRGSRRFAAGGDRRVDLAWDLTRARFPASGSPEPSSGFFVAVVVDGQMVLAAGDLPDAAYRKTRARRPPPGPRSVLLSRREHVAMRDAGEGRGHRTWVNVRGREREISMDLVSRSRGKDSVSREKERADVGLSVSIDGERVLHVRRLRWKFRGSERVDLGGGDRVQVSWDLHNWLFPQREPPPTTADTAAQAHAVFVFRFEVGGGDGGEAEEGKDLLDKDSSSRNKGMWRGYFERWGRRDWSETGSNGERKKKGRGRRLAMASSSSSASVASSTASWASSSTVMDWASPEEAEMQRGDGFSLLIYAWKS
ncbi:uncharacterized protein LOC100835247 [Brachypodium distachyon]|uniref:uncharacterized protein LOC100835247 n=1 Tax=Brachypodium distachyon TaxID=15368 RepID=UPI0001C74201|nr:uncharacterized protein LOC100835247 [Brachypodium distachyon]|eukprot:XP_003574544.1 uncharacterized protein LOC100835247 [Brachypodium distachyon]